MYTLLFVGLLGPLNCGLADNQTTTDCVRGKSYRLPHSDCTLRGRSGEQQGSHVNDPVVTTDCPQFADTVSTSGSWAGAGKRRRSPSSAAFDRCRGL